jgi:hypothetical protein
MVTVPAGVWTDLAINWYQVFHAAVWTACCPAPESLEEHQQHQPEQQAGSQHGHEHNAISPDPFSEGHCRTDCRYQEDAHSEPDVFLAQVDRHRSFP